MMPDIIEDLLALSYVPAVLLATGLVKGVASAVRNEKVAVASRNFPKGRYNSPIARITDYLPSGKPLLHLIEFTQLNACIQNALSSR